MELENLGVSCIECGAPIDGDDEYFCADCAEELTDLNNDATEKDQAEKDQ